MDEILLQTPNGACAQSATHGTLTVRRESSVWRLLFPAGELDPRALVGHGGTVKRPRRRVAHGTIVGGEKLVVGKLRRRHRGEYEIEPALLTDGISVTHFRVQVAIRRRVRTLARGAEVSVEHGALRRVEREHLRSLVRIQSDFRKLTNHRPRARRPKEAIARCVLPNRVHVETKVRVRARARVAPRRAVVVTHARRTLLIPPLRRPRRVRFRLTQPTTRAVAPDASTVDFALFILKRVLAHRRVVVRVTRGATLINLGSEHSVRRDDVLAREKRVRRRRVAVLGVREPERGERERADDRERRRGGSRFRTRLCRQQRRILVGGDARATDAEPFTDTDRRHRKYHAP